MCAEEQYTVLKTDPIISVVDDDVSVRNSMKRLLRSMEFEVRTFASALEFLQEGPLYHHGCVIVDVRMPGMSGLDFQKMLLECGISLPVIFITAYEDPATRTQAMQAGALAFLQKPLSDRLLADAIGLALERSSQQRSGSSKTVRGE
jgi:FixJ family two-component response regulator